MNTMPKTKAAPRVRVLRISEEVGVLLDREAAKLQKKFGGQPSVSKIAENALRAHLTGNCEADDN